jgi:vacuolar-type H+-ATPase subunit I/STV1
MPEENDFNPGNNNEDDGQGINPAWNDLLEKIPQDLHSQITPQLKDWDSGVQQKIQSVHSDYADYKFLRENKVDPEDVRVALGVLRAIQEDPRSVYDSLATSYGYNEAQQNSGQGKPESDLSGLPPEIAEKLQRLEGGYDTMAQILLEKQKQDEANAADVELEKEFKQLRDKHGEFDENFVIAQMMQGLSGDDAVKAYQSLVDRVLTDRAKAPAPRLLGSGTASIPGEGKVDVRKMDSGQTKQFVSAYLAARAKDI